MVLLDRNVKFLKSSKIPCEKVTLFNLIHYKNNSVKKIEVMIPFGNNSDKYHFASE